MRIMAYQGDQEKLIPPTETLANLLKIKDLKLEATTAAVPCGYHATASLGEMTGSGKGLTAEQAQASAAMECLERYIWLELPYKELPGYRYASYAALQAEGKTLVPKNYFFFNYLPSPQLDMQLPELLEVPMRWLPATRLNDGTEYYYPENYHSLLFSSNGLAAGNSLAEAQVQAICELIERENIRQLYLFGKSGRLLDQDSITSPYARDFLAAAQKSGITFELLEVGADIGVPTVIARGHDSRQAGTIFEWGVGQGAHLNPEMAVNRALAEYAEGRAIMAQAQEQMKIDFSKISSYWGRQHMGFLNLVNPENFRWQEVISIHDLPHCGLTAAEEQLAYLVKRCQEAGHELISFDMTNKEWQIPVVRVLSPTMGSIINTPFEQSYAVAAVVYYEGGRTKEALRLLVADTMANPQFAELRKNIMLSAMLPTIFGMFPAATLFGADYQANLKQRLQVKKEGLGIINTKLKELTTIAGGLVVNE